MPYSPNFSNSIAKNILRQPSSSLQARPSFHVYCNLLNIFKCTPSCYCKQKIKKIVYNQVFDAQTQPMPPSFVDFCITNAFITAFFQMIHLEYLILFPSYMVYILRFTLKASNTLAKGTFIASFLVAVGATIGLWYGQLLGLNIYGLCQVTFIRQPDSLLVPPIIFLVITIVFLAVGIFAIQYFKKHMPNTVGLRYKKYKQNKLLTYYMIGYSFFLISDLIITILLLTNCSNSDPSLSYLPLITVYNILRVVQFCYLFFILYNNLHFRKVLKKYLKKLVSKRNMSEEITDSRRHASHYFYAQNFDFQQFFLEIKDEKSQIDLLKMSQVLSIVCGIFIAYKQYYNLQDEYFTIVQPSKQNNLAAPEKIRVSRFHPAASSFRKNKSYNSLASLFSNQKNNSTRKIFYHQKMSVMLDYQIVKDYITDYSLIPHLGILKCQMIIHAPKIFQQLLQNDNLQNIFQSFELHENTKKMFDLVEGNGGRSGEFFFFSNDNKYVLKTITDNQFAFIQSNISYFFEHFKRYPHSLLSKIYGLFTFKGDQMQRTYHLIMMKNILGCSKEQIVRTYDLKGSSYDRQVAKEDISGNQYLNVTLKDTDFRKYEQTLKIKNEFKSALREIIETDTLFLKTLNIIDYSLLVMKVKWENQPRNPQFWGKYQRIKSVTQTTVDYSMYYHIGIIDILQLWDIGKKGQKWWKNLLGKKDISAQAPKKYQARFVDFVQQIIDSKFKSATQARDPNLINENDAYSGSNSVRKTASWIEQIKQKNSQYSQEIQEQDTSKKRFLQKHKEIHNKYIRSSKKIKQQAQESSKTVQKNVIKRQSKSKIHDGFIQMKQTQIKKESFEIQIDSSSSNKSKQ